MQVNVSTMEPGDASGRRRVSDADAELFRRSVGEVRRLRDDRAAPAPARRPKARRLDREPRPEPYEADPDAAFGERLEHASAGVQPRLLRRLRRGQLRVEDALDLHGLRVSEAHARLADFLADCRRRRLRCVRVVHGKGHGSRGSGPVIKASIGQWLRQDDAVVAFSSAPDHQGGTGALTVLLRRADPG